MIYTKAVIKIQGYECRINKPVVLYRGDKNVEVQFEIKNNNFKQYKGETPNVILNLDASYGQLVIQKPNGDCVISDVTETKNGAIVFVIPPELIDEETELGGYTFQIRLMNDDQTSRVTLPPVVNGIEIIESIAGENESGGVI